MKTDPSSLLEKALQQEDKSRFNKLADYHEVIATLRQKKWTYDKIVEFLKAGGIQVSVSWLHEYWKKNGQQVHPKLKKVEKNSSPKLSSDQKQKSKDVAEDDFHFEEFTEEDFRKAYGRN